MRKKTSAKTIIHMIGNAHLDPVWLWPWQAGADEALSTFRSAADRCDEYPEFIYTRGEAWLYQQVEKLDPALFNRVRRLIKKKRWHISGGQYIQPDANLPTDIGWRRQILHGQRYFQKKFKVQPRVGYNVDTFGHPGSLPDILAAHGYVGYVFHRPNAQQMELPAQTFRWRGVGGGEVLGFRIAPCYVTRSDDLYGQIMLTLEAADPKLGHTMCFYGVGNHGGGPTKANIQYILEHAEAFPGAELRFSTPEIFFEAAAEKRRQLPVVTGELQNTFPGCYSVMHDIKQNQHHGERLLEQAEQVIEVFSGRGREQWDYRKRLDAAWEDFLFTQFHDILAGTSVQAAWPGVRAMQGRGRIIGEEVIYEASRRWGRSHLPEINHQQIAILNPQDSPWEDWLEWEPFLDFDHWGDRWISDVEGNPVEFQRIQPGGDIPFLNRILFKAKAPAAGAALYLVRDDVQTARPRKTGRAAATLKATKTTLSNGMINLTLAPEGISALRLRNARANLLGRGGIGLHLREDKSDTWTFLQSSFEEPVVERFSGTGWVVEESGPLRARVRSEGHVGESSLRWTITLHQGDPRVFLRVEVNFNSRYRLLQMPVMLHQSPKEWVDAIPGSQITRFPAATEFPVQGWSRIRTARGDLVILTPDAYSLSHQGNCWQWTLLRSPRMAWGGGERRDFASGRDLFTDQGPHTFEFILWPEKSLSDEVLHRAVRRMVQPPVVFDRYDGMNRPPWGNSPPRSMWTGAEQRALQDGKMEHLKQLPE
jgi:alpha-mannosidase